MVRSFLGSAKIHKRVVQLEEWIQDKKVPDVEYHSSCVDVDHLENNK